VFLLVDEAIQVHLVVAVGTDIEDEETDLDHHEMNEDIEEALVEIGWFLFQMIFINVFVKNHPLNLIQIHFVRSPTSKTLHVKNLTRTVKEDHLREIFGVYGDVKRVEIVWDRKINVPLDYGFVEFTKPADAERALNYLDGVRCFFCFFSGRKRF
jgi:hypothetical protein